VNGDGPCLAPVEQDWEDVSPVEVHLGSCVNMGPSRRLARVLVLLNTNRLTFYPEVVFKHVS